MLNLSVSSLSMGKRGFHHSWSMEWQVLGWNINVLQTNASYIVKTWEVTTLKWTVDLGRECGSYAWLCVPLCVLFGIMCNSAYHTFRIKSLILSILYRHYPKVEGSNPSPATNKISYLKFIRLLWELLGVQTYILKTSIPASTSLLLDEGISFNNKTHALKLKTTGLDLAISTPLSVIIK